MKAKCFSQIYWGLILSIPNFTFQGMNVSTDFIGYALVALGLQGLKDESKQFSFASQFAWALAGISLINYVLPDKLSSISEWLNLLIDTCMIWNLLGGINAYANNNQQLKLAGRAFILRGIYIILAVAMATIGAMGIAHWVSPMMVLSFIILVMIIFLVHAVRVKIALGKK